MRSASCHIHTYICQTLIKDIFCYESVFTSHSVFFRDGHTDERLIKSRKSKRLVLFRLSKKSFPLISPTVATVLRRRRPVQSVARARFGVAIARSSSSLPAAGWTNAFATKIYLNGSHSALKKRGMGTRQLTMSTFFGAYNGEYHFDHGHCGRRSRWRLSDWALVAESICEAKESQLYKPCETVPLYRHDTLAAGIHQLHRTCGGEITQLQNNATTKPTDNMTKPAAAIANKQYRYTKALQQLSSN